MDPLKYGRGASKFIKEIGDSKFIQINDKNMAVIKTEVNKDNNLRQRAAPINYVEIYSEGNLIMDYIDTQLTQDSFQRKIGDNVSIFEKEEFLRRINYCS